MIGNIAVNRFRTLGDSLNFKNTADLNFKVVDTAEKLKLEDGSNPFNQYILMAGYYSAGDGGGNLFIARGLTLVASIFDIGEYRRLKIQNCVNIKHFGATGDGINDDSVFINLAIGYAKEEKINRIVFPNGQYLINSPIMIDGFANLELDFSGCSFLQGGKEGVKIVDSKNILIKNLVETQNLYLLIINSINIKTIMSEIKNLEVDSVSTDGDSIKVY